MEKINSKTFCPLPWIHLATRPNGDVRLCCTANASGAGIDDEKEVGLVKDKGVRLNLQNNSLKQIWNSEFMRQTRLDMLNNKIPNSCTKCFQEEKQGIVSKRQWETQVWRERLDIEAVVAKTDTEGYLPVEIPYFDLRLGNLCQLKCVMCSPHDSSAWIKDWKIQYPQYQTFELRQDQRWDNDFDYVWYQKNSFIDSVKDQSQYIKELYFAGGEPLLIPEHYRILEFMVESGNAKNCYLRYNSNGLELPEKLFDLWKHFKEVKFNFSIDAYAEKNEYIRYPSKWKNIVENLKRLDDTPSNIKVNIACAVQLLNVLYVPELARWKVSQNFKKINLPPFGAGLIGTHLVYLPSYLNVRALPIFHKNLVKKEIENFCDSLKSNQEFQLNPYGLKRWQGLIHYMFSEDWSSKLKLFEDYISVLDNQRQTNFKQIFPELSNII